LMAWTSSATSLPGATFPFLIQETEWSAEI